MRLLMAGMLAVAAFGLAAPSFAQQEDPAATPAPQAPAPVPQTKAKPGTVAYCQSLKGSSQRSSCLKKVHAQASSKGATTVSAKKTKKPSTAPKPVQPDAAQTLPPAAAPAAAAAAPPPAPTGPVAVPPLPQKTI
jgi:hypothetical protein